MDFTKALAFPFKDQNWFTKMIWFSAFLLLSVILVGLPFVIGYMVLVVKSTIDGEEKLPDWSGNLGNIFGKGLQFGAFIIVFAVFAGVIGMIGGDIFTFLLDIIYSVVSPLALARFADTEKLSELFKVNWYVEFVKKNWQNILLIVIFSSVGGVIAGFGLFLFIIGIFFTMYVFAIAYANLVGQMYVIGSGSAKPDVQEGEII